MFGTFSLFLYPSINDDDDDADIILASYSNERGDAHDAAVNAVSHSTIRQIALSFGRRKGLFWVWAGLVLRIYRAGKNKLLFGKSPFKYHSLCIVF